MFVQIDREWVYTPSTKGVYTGDMETQTHTGPVQIRRTSWGVSVLCCMGHMVTARSDKDMRGGSGFAADFAAWAHDPTTWIVTCGGAVAA